MTSQVLYRRWRPQRFSDVVAQQPITQTLSKAVATGRVAHAYLFCGPRGTGKTSTARVLAKAINCLDRPEGSGDPCGVCTACRAIEDGAFVDLLEIDAASNRGIDEIRSLREKVHYAPSQAASKVYIIDEAHMLTEAAFNAFLKTLEEPPAHAIFILATTEAHKLPPTIISRCQRFDFHRIPLAGVVARLGEIATAEGVEASPEVLRDVARAGGGSLRDAENLLEQLVTSYGSTVTAEAVRELLGADGEERAVALVKHLLYNETSQALALINSVASEGLDLRPLHHTTVDCLRAVLLVKTGAKDSADLSTEAEKELTPLASQVPLEQIMRALRLFGQVNMKHDQPSPLPLELATVELGLEPEPSAAPRPAPAPMAEIPAPIPPRPITARAAPPERAAPPPPPSNPAPIQVPVASASNEPDQEPSGEPDERLVTGWLAILRSMSGYKGRRFDIGALLRSSKSHYLDGSTLVVRFAHRSNVERLQDELEEPRCRLALEEQLKQILGDAYAIRVEAEENGARSAQDQGHLVRTAINMGGHVIPEPEHSEEANE
jgi:DNA polymerase-3 subunit gamma/tau